MMCQMSPTRGLDSSLARRTCCGCAGCFTAPFAPELYATAFDSVGQLDKLAGFLSTNGAVTAARTTHPCAAHRTLHTAHR